MRRALCLGLALLLFAHQASAEWTLEGLLSRVETRTEVWSSQQLLRALNSTAGSASGELLVLTDDIHILPADVQAFQPWLPINGGNRTVVLQGGKPGAVSTTLDFGGAVNLMYHPVGHAFYTFGLTLQGMAPASAGIAAGMTTQMVGGVFWPSTTGEAQHIMGFWNSTIRTVNPSCGFNATNFAVTALHQVLNRTDTVRLIDDRTFFVGQPLNGSYAVRVLETGDAAGAVRWSLYNTTMSCRQPEAGASAALPSPTNPAEAAALMGNQTGATGVAGNADELLFLLASPQVTRIVLGGHISLHAAHWQAHSLPLVLQDRSVVVEAHDQQLKVLDLGGHPNLLYLSATSSLTFSHVFLQGASQPSAAMGNRSTIIAGSPVWPTVDGEQGHQLLFLNSSLQAYATPCSPSSTQLTKGRLRQVLGDEAILDIGATGYLIVPRFRETEPIRSVLTREQVGSTPYTFENTVVQCQEDPGAALSAAQLPQEPGGTPAWAVAVVALAAVAGAGVAAAAGVLVWRRRRRRSVDAAKVDSTSKPDRDGRSLPPVSPSCARAHRMESGDLDEADEQLQFDSKVACRPIASLDSFGALPSGGTTGKGSSAAQQLSEAGRRGRDALWRARFGVIDGLEIGELVGRGAFGKVYKGRWNGAIVAVKVVEHSVAGDDPSSVSREPLLCMSVSHPNCITTYKLSVIRLLRSEGLLESDDSVLTLPDVRLSNDSIDSATSVEGSTLAGGKGPRLLRSLLSGAEAVAVEDPHSPLQPGLYETWIVSEYCERGTLGDVLAQKALRLADGRPHMANIYLCLLDVATGMQYLHSLGVMHSDLKPANVLLKGSRASQRGFTCKLADFGLSRMLDVRASHVQTGSYGTPTHAAPELLREGRLSPAVDVFAFGILAWELVAGEDAYRGWHPMQIIVQVSQHGARPPPLPHCPPALAALMERCWAQEPADRPSFTEILADLQPMLQAVRPGAPPTPPRQPPAPLPPDRQAPAWQAAAEVGANRRASLDNAEAGNRASAEPSPAGEAGLHPEDQHIANIWQHSASSSQAAACSEAAR